MAGVRGDANVEGAPFVRDRVVARGAILRAPIFHPVNASACVVGACFRMIILALADGKSFAGRTLVVPGTGIEPVRPFRDPGF